MSFNDVANGFVSVPKKKQIFILIVRVTIPGKQFENNTSEKEKFQRAQNILE